MTPNTETFYAAQLIQFFLAQKFFKSYKVHSIKIFSYCSHNFENVSKELKILV